jgi:hypothetical protein
MIIRNAGRAEIERAAGIVGVRAEIEDRSNSRATIHRVRLFPRGDHRRAVSSSGRRVNAVSWAGHRDFFRALFGQSPRADIRTGFAVGARYTSPEQFERTFEETGWTNVGSRYRPFYANENEYDPEHG